MVRRITNLLRRGLLTISIFSLITIPSTCIRDYSREIDPSVASLFKRVLNEGIRYSIDEKTGARYYFKKVDGKTIYVSIIDRKPYGKSNNDQLTIDQEYWYPPPLRYTKVTDKGLDGNIDRCQGDCEILGDYLSARVNGILNHTLP